jgi:hypothetical protein
MTPRLLPYHADSIILPKPCRIHLVPVVFFGFIFKGHSRIIHGVNNRGVSVSACAATQTGPVAGSEAVQLVQKVPIIPRSSLYSRDVEEGTGSDFEGLRRLERFELPHPPTVCHVFYCRVNHPGYRLPRQFSGEATHGDQI